MNSDGNPVEMNQKTFLSCVDHGQIAGLFDQIPGYSFFIKNAAGEIMKANPAFYQRLGYTTEFEIVGRRDHELFPAGLADHFRRDDVMVMQRDEPLLGIVELFFNRQGLPDWYLTNKFPVHDHARKVIGVMGTVRSYASQAKFIQPFVQIEPAVDHIRNNFREKICVKELAQRVGLSPRQFDRKFQEAFGISPQNFVIKTRILAACDELADLGQPIADVAIGLGFCDQSSFTMHFRRHMGVTPLQYRRRLGSRSNGGASSCSRGLVTRIS